MMTRMVAWFGWIPLSLMMVGGPISARAGVIQYDVTDLGAVPIPSTPDVYDGNYPQYRDGRAPHFDAAGQIIYGPTVPYGYYTNAPIFNGPKFPGRPDVTLRAVVSAGNYTAGVASDSLGTLGYHAFVSDGVSTRALPDDKYGTQFAINQSGQMIASGWLSDYLYSFRDGSTVTLYGIHGFTNNLSQAFAINDAGVVVGRSSYDFNNPFGDMHAWIASNPGLGFPTDLNDLIDIKSGWTLNSASGIASDGRIVGTGHDSEGTLSYFLLTPRPVPEPSAVALLGIALLTISAHRIRTSQRDGSEGR